MTDYETSRGVGNDAHAVAEAARNTAEIIEKYGDSPVAMMGCIIEKGTYLASLHQPGLRGLKVEPGGSIVAGYVMLRDGARIRALPEGGFVIDDGSDPEETQP
jgi:hypothetical protein